MTNATVTDTASTRSSAEQPWPVRVVSQKIGAWISRLGEVWVEGQITELTRRPGSPMAFVTLRDPSAEISLLITCRRSIADGLSEGSRVVARAKPEFYAARGTLSLRASEFRAVGIGELLARLEQLKALLSAEGLFAAERKRPLPFLPHRVGLITGRASAAERDVLHNAARRWPAVQFEVRTVAVQGASAVPQVIAALGELDAHLGVDVIIIARGGGSVEDLLPFSDEALCRAVFGCTTPVVSAIGHEPDSPLLDLVADVRCSTPTDAGKRVVPDLAEQTRQLMVLRDRARRCVTTLISREQQRLHAVRSRPIFAAPMTMVRLRADELEGFIGRARRHLNHSLNLAESEVKQLRARTAALSPQATLDRGYAIVQQRSGAVVRQPDQVQTGEQVRLRLAGGERAACIQ
ncbi:MAG: exodeoxyribonuclease VII large subunit [Acidimicrobiales bacterium]|nr:MAG: exodeoxyribonuclease VII large subunit [Acidimicrobiales bacterium]